jgi:pimeloyl-ACP methyl ester carboxylesterase
MSDHPTQTTKRTSVKLVAGSLLAGVVSAAALVAGPFADGGEATITGAILLGFAIGWALLAVLSSRAGDESYRWAAVPATVLGLSAAGLIILSPDTQALDTLGWIWPPLLLGLVIWMVAQTRRQSPTRRPAWLLYPVFALMALSAIGCGVQTVESGSGSTPAPVAGDRLVDVGGHQLNIRCVGSGSPTVVLEPGLGESSSAIARRIAPDVAHTTRVCVYDRAGHGRSDVAPDADAARDLHVLLERAHVPPPYVMAGHSLGGALVLSYAHRYPSQVGGVVLLDSMYPHQTHTAANGGMAPLLAVVPTLARTGIARLLVDPRDGEPMEEARQLVRDVKAMPAQLDRAAELTSLGDRPLYVVTAGKGSQPGWTAHQNDLARLSTDSFHRTVAGSTHQSLIDDASDAAASSRAIRDIVAAVRHEHAAR